MPAENLITDHELAVWAQVSDEEIENSEFAQDLIKRMSDYARFLGFSPIAVDHADYGWQTRELTPFDVKLCVLKVCRRTFDNVREVIQEGNIGPLGGDRIREEAARGMELTELERVVFTKYNLAGDPETGENGQLWVQPIDAGNVMTSDEILYVGDDMQINLNSSADPRQWKIPLFNPGDPGSEGPEE